MLIILIIIANNSQLISDSLVFTYRINQVTQLRKLTMLVLCVLQTNKKTNIFTSWLNCSYNDNKSMTLIERYDLNKLELVQVGFKKTGLAITIKAIF